MNLSLSRKRFEVRSVIGEETVQVMAEGTAVVPRQRPPIDRILSMDILPEIDEVKASDGLIEVKGSMDVSLLYVCKREGGEESVYSLDVKDALSFERDIDLPDVDDGVEIIARASLMDFDLELSGPTEVDIDVVLGITVKAFRNSTFRVLTDVVNNDDEEIDVSKDTLKFIKTIELQPSYAMVERVLDVPSDQPLIERIIKPYIDLKLNGVQVFDGKVIVRGTLNGQVIYGADSEGGADSIQSFEREVGEFLCELELPAEVAKDGIDGEPRVKAYLTDVQCEILGDGEQVRIVGEVKVKGEIDKVRIGQVVVDIKSDDDKRIEVETTSIKVEKPVNRGSTRITAEQAFEVENDDAPIERVLRCTAVPLLNTCKVVDGTALFEGNVKMTAVYVSVSEGASYVYSLSGVTPFEGSINISGAEEGMSVFTDVKADRPSFHVIGQDRIEMAVGLALNANISETDEAFIVDDAVVVQPVSKEPGLTIYMVQNGDTLWRISRRYAVEPNILLAANGLEGFEDIMQGRKLIIPRT